MRIEIRTYRGNGLLVDLVADVDRDGVILWLDTLDPATGAHTELSSLDKWLAVSDIHRAIERQRAAS
jgi:hypothetical protein